MSDGEYDLLMEMLSTDFGHFADTGRFVAIQNIGLEEAMKDEEVKPHLTPPRYLARSKEPVKATAMAEEIIQRDGAVLLEHKLDGVAMRLYYRKGKLEYALLRGTGHSGIDVSRHAWAMSDIPNQIDLEGGEDWRIFSGEAYVTKDSLRKINTDRTAKEQKVFINCRSLAGACLRSKNNQLTVSADLKFKVFEEEFYGEYECDYVWQDRIEKIKELGFNVLEPQVVREGVIKHLNKIAESRDDLEYDIDGVVIKSGRYNIRNNQVIRVVGEKADWALAYKFPPPQAISSIERIDLKPTLTGRLHPTGVIKPVKIRNKTISTINLFNLSFIKVNGIDWSKEIVVELQNDVVGGFSMVKTKSDKPMELPTKCPSCSNPIKIEGDEMYCTGFEMCPDILKGRLKRLLGREALDLRPFTESIVDELVDKGIVSSTAGFFSLKEEDFQKLDTVTEKTMKRIMPSYNDRFKTSRTRLVFGLGIPGIATAKASDLVSLAKGDVDLLTDYVLSECKEAEIYKICNELMDLPWVFS